MNTEIFNMKNIHLLPTDKPSRLHLAYDKDYYLSVEPFVQLDTENYKSFNIYITNSEEIKEGDWFIANNGVHKCIRIDKNTSYPFITLNAKGEEIGHFKTWKTKIILTTDQDLDGVQPIDNEFLTWFVNNPSCESVEVEKLDTFKKTNEVYVDEITRGNYYEIIKEYKIIIPKEEPKQIKCYCGHTITCDCGPLEEPKQETLEEAAESYRNSIGNKNGTAKFDFIRGARWQQERMYSNEEVLELLRKAHFVEQNIEEWFEQFKKK